MGREIRRVALDFEWELNKRWLGFVNPWYKYYNHCSDCENGYSPEGEYLHKLWWGYAPFKPEDNGSVPFTEDNEYVLKLATRNTKTEEDISDAVRQLRLKRECRRLLRDCFNNKWQFHLNEEDVKALLAEDKLPELTRNGHIPTAQEVNNWSIVGFGHGGGHTCIKARLEKQGKPLLCDTCKGEGHFWESAEYEKLAEEWCPEDPPAGEGYQCWETVSEGSPISPVFETPEELAEYMASHPWGADKGTSADQWLKFIKGPGWAPSAVMTNNGVQSGVEFIASQGN